MGRLDKTVWRSNGQHPECLIEIATATLVDGTHYLDAFSNCFKPPWLWWRPDRCPPASYPLSFNLHYGSFDMTLIAWARSPIYGEAGLINGSGDVNYH